MASSTPLSSALLLLLLLPLLSHAATFTVVNQCPYTVWAAAVPGGGQQLDQGQTWAITANPGTTGGRVWGRTGCTFNDTGHGSCQTGDCGDLLECTTNGTPPNTLAEYALTQFANLDFYDISLVDGFNVPIDLAPTATGCPDARRSADITGQCPSALKVPGGCNNPCTVFKTDEYCCTGASSSNCGNDNYTRFFKNLCPNAYINYTGDDNGGTTCPTGTNYTITFCP